MATVTVPGRPEIVPALRTLVGSLLPHHPARDDIHLMATELLSNAIRHTRSGEDDGALTLTVLDLGHATRVEVIDQGRTTDRPHLRDDMQRDSEDGYGLRLLTLLATTWEAVAWGEGSKT